MYNPNVEQINISYTYLKVFEVSKHEYQVIYNRIDQDFTGNRCANSTYAMISHLIICDYVI